MYNSKRQKNMIIGGLLAIVCIMAIGYAAFATNLNISGSGAISSNWSVKITNITSKDIVGTAGNKTAPSYTDTTATFATKLQSPGDSITYDITVSNEGTLDAVLNTITLTNSNNPAITFETSGLTEGDDLLKNTTKTITVKVTYKSSVTSQPENVTANLTVTLNFGQKGLDSNGIAVPGITTNELKALVVITGDGLYADSVESGRYIYRGAKPDNYITFNDETWRIISVESDGTIKIIKQDSIGGYAWDTAGNRTTANYCNYASDYGCNSWGSSTTMLNTSGAIVTSMPREYGGTAYALPTTESTLNIYLNGTYYNSLTSTAQSKIVSHNFNVGVLAKVEGQTTATDVTQEQTYKWKGKIALANASDYVRADTGSSCTGVYAGYYGNCSSFNWMYKSGFSWWTLSPYSYSYSYDVLVAGNAGNLGDIYAYYAYGVRPVVFLSSDTTLSGSGTSSDPYTITG